MEIAVIAIGYMLKNVVCKPEWLKAAGVDDVYSVSNCISGDFADYMNFWEHNGYWFFNSAEVIQSLANREQIDVSHMTMFYYEVYEKEYEEDSRAWSTFEPEPSLETAVIEPAQRKLAGFDVVTFSQHTSPECSPLSCNSIANELRVNAHCLFNTFDEAKRALEEGKFKMSEPGPFRIVGVYVVAAELR